MSVVRNTAYNIASALVPIAVSLLTVPAYIHAIGEERYGVLALIAMLLGYFGVFDFGLSTATAQRIASNPAGDLDKRRRIFWTASVTNLGFGLLGSLLAFPVALIFADHAIKAPAALMPEIKSSIIWLVLALPIMLLTGVFRGALQGAGRFAEMNLVNVVLGTLTQLIPLAVAIWITPSLTVILPALYASRLLVLGGFLAVVIARVTQGFHALFDRNEARALLSFGGWMTLSGLISPIIASLDRFLIGSVIGVRQVSHYSVPYQLSERAMFVPSALVQALFPRISGAPDQASARALSRRGLYSVAAICAPPMVFGTLFMYPFLSLWIDRDFAEHAALIGQVVLSGFWINALGFVCYNHLTAVGRPKLVALAHAIEIVPYCLILVGLMSGFGLVGAALAFVLRVAADDLLLAHYSGILRPTAILVASGAVIFAIATWLGLGLDLHQTGRVIIALAYFAGVSFCSVIWLMREKDALLAALRVRKTET